MRRISMFDDGTIPGIKPTGSLRGELRENEIKEIIYSSYHNTNSHQAVSVEQFDATQDPCMLCAQFIQRKWGKQIIDLTWLIQEIRRIGLV